MAHPLVCPDYWAVLGQALTRGKLMIQRCVQFRFASVGPSPMAWEEWVRWGEQNSSGKRADPLIGIFFLLLPARNTSPGKKQTLGRGGEV
jgi:hypothetical protein